MRSSAAYGPRRSRAKLRIEARVPERGTRRAPVPAKTRVPNPPSSTPEWPFPAATLLIGTACGSRERALEACSMQVRRDLLPPAGRRPIRLARPPARLLSQRCPTIQVPEGLLVQLACERHDLDPSDLLASAHSRVEEVGHCRRVATVRERPCRLIARGDSSVEYHHGDAAHLCRRLGRHPPFGYPSYEGH